MVTVCTLLTETKFPKDTCNKCQQQGLVDDVNVPLLSPEDSNKPVNWSVSERTRERKVFEGGEVFEGQVLSDAQGHSSVSYCLMTFVSTRDRPCDDGPVVFQST